MTEYATRPRIVVGQKALAALAIAALGAVVFLVALFTTGPVRAWQAYLVNWLFWSGMAQGGVVFAAIIDATDSSWGRPAKRVAECFVAFLPVSFVMFLLMWPGLPYLYVWIGAPVPGLETWLSRGFMFARDAAALLVLYGASVAYVHHSIRPDFGVKRDGARTEVAFKKPTNWKGAEVELKTALERRRILAPLVIILYGLVYSLIGCDLVMSLTPMWYSTLFGAYIFMVNIFGAIAMVAIVAVWLRDTPALKGVIHEPQFHDLGKTLQGFCLLCLDFFWSQFLVIWYGNLPEETDFLILRAFTQPWSTISRIVLYGGFLAPFLLLIRRSTKADPRQLMAISVWIVATVWLERFALIAPAVWTQPGLPLGAFEIVATAGFGALFFLAVGSMFDRVPATPLSDPVFVGGPAPHHLAGETEKV